MLSTSDGRWVARARYAPVVAGQRHLRWPGAILDDLPWSRPPL